MPFFFQGRLMIDVSCLSEAKKNDCVIHLKSPSPWFDTNGKTQRKLMQKHLSVMKNGEMLEAYFNQQIDNMQLCYCLRSKKNMTLKTFVVKAEPAFVFRIKFS